MNGGDAAVRLLLRLKWRGFWRRQARRLRTGKGLLLALPGALLVVWWGAAFLIPSERSPLAARLGPELTEGLIQVLLAGLTLVTFANAFSFRGLYIPASEIETLFAAPLSRPALVRMRMAITLLRSAVGAVFGGCAAMRLASEPLFGFAGGFVAFVWIAVLGQGLSLLLGSAENRVAALFAKAPVGLLRSAGIACTAALLYGLIVEGPDMSPLTRSPLDWLRGISQAPLLGALLAPFWPFARAVAATSAAEFWPAFGGAVAILGASLAAVAQSTVDYRETALATSAELARRLARMRRGLGAGGVQAKRLPLSWRTPWLFGRGPFGAIAFAKSASILRKARAGVVFAVMVMAAVTFFASRHVERPADAWGAAALVAGFGTFYLTLGLRYDFREELDHLGAIRAWPLASWRIFAATLAPQVLLVSLFVDAGVAFVLARAGEIDARFALLALAVTLAVSVWVAIDNIVFLLAPTRSAPGNDGVLQNAGRSLLLGMLRSLTMLAVVAAAAAPSLVAIQIFGAELDFAFGIGAASALAVLGACAVASVALGGWALARFDVSRER
ncbi:MAG: hypothetical protein JNN27_04970 [Planctomycetes bacterium]|nr:hypothetical protein [Planctomycetota bacterium]